MSSTVSPAALAKLAPQSLESVLTGWGVAIEQMSSAFHRQARQVQEWDRKVIENTEKIEKMRQVMDSVRASQRDLEQNLDLIDMKQNELHGVLGTLEQEMERLDQAALGPADLEREQGYVQAERINTQLNTMAATMKELIDRLNEGQEPAASDNPVSQIVQILNAHLNSLQWIDQNVALLSGKLADLEGLLRGAK